MPSSQACPPLWIMFLTSSRAFFRHPSSETRATTVETPTPISITELTSFQKFSRASCVSWSCTDASAILGSRRQFDLFEGRRNCLACCLSEYGSPSVSTSRSGSPSHLHRDPARSLHLRQGRCQKRCMGRCRARQTRRWRRLSLRRRRRRGSPQRPVVFFELGL